MRRPQLTTAAAPTTQPSWVALTTMPATSARLQTPMTGLAITAASVARMRKQRISMRRPQLTTAAAPTTQPSWVALTTMPATSARLQTPMTGLAITAASDARMQKQRITTWKPRRTTAVVPTTQQSRGALTARPATSARLQTPTTDLAITAASDARIQKQRITTWKPRRTTAVAHMMAPFNLLVAWEISMRTT